jgi:hypothetical protein
MHAHHPSSVSAGNFRTRLRDNIAEGGTTFALCAPYAVVAAIAGFGLAGEWCFGSRASRVTSRCGRRAHHCGRSGSGVHCPHLRRHRPIGWPLQLTAISSQGGTPMLQDSSLPRGWLTGHGGLAACAWRQN